MTQKNWLGTYGKTPIQKFQQGGPMGGEQGAPQGAPAGGEAPGGNIDAMLAEYAQTRDPQLAVAIADALLEMMSQGGGGEAAPAPEGAPAPQMGKNGLKMNRGPVFKLK